MHNIGKQTGVALVTVLLVVVLATIAAVAMTNRQQLDIRRTENILHHDQAYLYLLVAENFAIRLLQYDLEDNKTDTFSDNWNGNRKNGGEHVLPFEFGVVTGKIEDMQAKFNINSLLVNGEPSTENIERFKRLLLILELNPTLSDSVLDWLDADDEQRALGAEDGIYLTKNPPYRAANRYMSSPGELLYVNGFSYEIYEKLLPFVVTLPQNSDININTAPAEVIASLVDGINLEAANQLVSERGESGYESVEDFLKHQVFKGKKVQKTGLSVSSSHFILKGEVIMGDKQAYLTSMVRRNSKNDIVVFQRSGV